MKNDDQIVQQKLMDFSARLNDLRKLYPGRAFPKNIWSEATGLAKILGVRPVTKELRLFYPRLKSLVSTGKYQRIKTEKISYFIKMKKGLTSMESNGSSNGFS